MHLPPAQRGPPRRRAAAGAPRSGPGLPVAVVVGAASVVPTPVGASPAPPPPPPPPPTQPTTQHPHPHQARPSAPQHAPVVVVDSAPTPQTHQQQLWGGPSTMAEEQEQQQEQQQQPAPPAEAPAAPSALSSFEQDAAAMPPPQIIAPLRVRRRVKRPEGNDDQHASNHQHQHHTDRRRSPAARQPPQHQQPPPQHHHHHHNHTHTALLASLVVAAAGAVAAYYCLPPPAAFAGPEGVGGIAAAGSGGGGSEAARLVATAAAAAAAAAASSTAPTQSSSSTSAGPPVRLLAVVGAGPEARSPYAYSAPTADVLRQQGSGGDPTAAPAPSIPPPPLWSEVAPHLAYRLRLSNPRFQLEVLREEDLIQALDGEGGGPQQASAVLARALQGQDPRQQGVVAIVAMGLTDARTAELLSSPSSPAASVGTLLALPTDDEKHHHQNDGANPTKTTPFSLIAQRASFYSPSTANPLTTLLAERVPFSPQARAAKLLRDTTLLLSRRTSDDAVFALLSVIHAYGGVSVPDVANAAQGGPDLSLLICVFTHCREPVLNCVNDPGCKATLDCLSNVPPNDQVASYRCIVAGEGKLFTEFTKCVVLKHNCRGLTATTPTEPNPPPMRSFANSPMTHETAEAILFGHGVDASAAPASAKAVALVPGTRQWAWRIAGGKNAAFDRFPAQHQLFYRTGPAPPGSKGGAVWYVPIFAVAPDGELLKEKVWRERKYRVRRDDETDEPGRFLFTVSDNGATSKEYWTLLDADDYSGNLEWALFYYRGSAPEAGMAYSGAVLGTTDGEWPKGLKSAERIEAALKSAGIEPWELTRVDNSPDAVAGAPLLPHGGWGSAGGVATASV